MPAAAYVHLVAPERGGQVVVRPGGKPGPAAQSYGLPKLGTISAQVRGSPDDAQRAIAARANQSGATYYQILMLDETVLPGFWYATAILYGPSTGTGSQQ